MLKKDGYYYAILAEGGTGYSHSITTARSTHLYGPYEPCPYNPILTQTDPDAPIQRAGHGKLVETRMENGGRCIYADGPIKVAIQRLGGRPLWIPSNGRMTAGLSSTT
nr:family 43 glycosylhydrolase [Bacillus licheniformis]